MNPSIRKLVITTFLLVYCSAIVWYDLRILSARGVIGGIDLGSLLLVWGALLLPFVILFLTKVPNKIALRWYGILYATYIFVSLATGLWLKNNTTDTAGDFYKSLFIPAGVGLYFYAKPLAGYFEILLLRILSAFILLRFTIFVFFMGGLNKLYYGTAYDAIFMALSFPQFKVKRKAYIHSLNALAWITVLLGQKRALVLGFGVLVVSHMKSWKLIVLGIFAFLAIAAFQDTLFHLIANSRFGSLMSFQSLIESQVRRTSEVTEIIAIFESNPIRIFTGYGFGAEISFYDLKTLSYIDVHSIHNSIFATVYRSGVLGAVLTVVFLGAAVFNMMSKNTRTEGILLLVLLCSSLFFYTFFDELLVGYFIAKINDRRGRVAIRARKT